MKANAPQRIYLVIDPVWGSMSVNYNRNDTNNIEYTRTDAFIEKASWWIDKTLRNTDFYENEIELMVKEFKKAMML